MRFISAVSLGLMLNVVGCADKVPFCNPDHCSGCCDSNDSCQSGTAVDACGSGGLACNVCVPAAGQVCANTVCAKEVSVTPDGGSDAGQQPDSGQAVDAGPDAGPVVGAEIGTGDHSPSSVVLTEIARSAAGLNRPTDLDFNPHRRR